MPLDAASYKQLIIDQVGDDAAGTLAAKIDSLWAANDDQSDLAARFLYAKRDAIDVMLAKVRGLVDQSEGDASVKLGQLFSHLMEMRKAVETRIASGVDAAAAGGAAGEITRTTPIVVDDASQPNPSGRVYRGDPLRPRWPRR